MYNRLERLEKWMVQFSKVSGQFNRLKDAAVKIEHHQMAIEAATVVKSITKLHEIFERNHALLINAEIEAGTRKKIEVANLDKPKLTLLKGGK